VEKEIKAQVEEAIQFAEESPLPDASELYEDVYVQTDYPFVKD
jgi:pyruvate dehydrogenase E1 component alpha subunit